MTDVRKDPVQSNIFLILLESFSRCNGFWRNSLQPRFMIVLASPLMLYPLE
jgi:hypothetical protein